MKRLYFLIPFLTFLTIGFSQNSEPNIKPVKINRKFNTDYKKSIELTTGLIDSLCLIQFQSALNKSLSISNDFSKPIVIGYIQGGYNCISNSKKTKYNGNILSGYKKGITQLEDDFNVDSYMIYTQNSHVKDSPCEGCILDNAFIKATIFPSDQNCMGFFVLFTDGTFYKYYGEDYFSILTNILKSNPNN
jgi:hypothetical protein